MRFCGFMLLCSFLMADDSWMVYDDSSVGSVFIYVDSASLVWMYDNVESDSMHVANIHYQNSFIDETVENVGFRLRGNTSRVSQKKSFKLDFNHFVPGRDFYDVEKINLNGEHNDVSIIRSKLAWDLFDSIGMTASRANHVEVYINESYYGLYISVEHIDDTFLSKRFQDDSGNLWRCLWPADLTYRGPDPEDYHPWIDDERPYDLKTNEDEYNFAQLARLVNIINNDPDSLDHVLDITGFIKYLAINILTGSWDDYRSLRNNYYLYYVPNKDQFQFIPYDYDNTFGIDWFDMDWATIDPYSYYLIDNSDRPLADIIMDNGSFRNLFTHFLSFYLDHHFSLELWENWIDSTKFMIDSSAYYDVYRTLDYGFTFDDFTNSYSVTSYNNQHIKNGLKEFIIERVSSLENQIDYLNAEPFVYDVWWEPKNPVTGDSITIHASAFGYPNIDHINVITIQAGYKASNLTFPTDTPEIEFITADANNKGNGDRFYNIVNEYDLTDAVLRFEINAGLDSSAFGDSTGSFATLNPSLYIYETRSPNSNIPDRSWDKYVVDISPDSLQYYLELPGVDYNSADANFISIPYYKIKDFNLSKALSIFSLSQSLLTFKQRVLLFEFNLYNSMSSAPCLIYSSLVTVSVSEFKKY